jgi:hypothetical protein
MEALGTEHLWQFAGVALFEFRSTLGRATEDIMAHSKVFFGRHGDEFFVSLLERASSGYGADNLKTKMESNIRRIKRHYNEFENGC